MGPVMQLSCLSRLLPLPQRADACNACIAMLAMPAMLAIPAMLAVEHNATIYTVYWLCCPVVCYSQYGPMTKKRLIRASLEP